MKYRVFQLRKKEKTSAIEWPTYHIQKAEGMLDREFDTPEEAEEWVAVYGYGSIYLYQIVAVVGKEWD